MFGIFNQFKLSLEKEVMEIFAKISIGAAGAPTLSLGKGISSVVRNSAGTYTVTFSGPIPVFLFAKFIHLASVAQDLNFQVLAVNIANKTVQFACLTGATATDPANGTVLHAVFSGKRMDV